MKFGEFESGLYLAIAKAMDSKSPLQAYEFPGGFRSGHVLIGDDSDPIYVVFSFPNKSDDCYVMITDGDPKELAKQMAALQEYNENTAHLCNGHTVPTDCRYLNESGWHAYLVTSPTITFGDFPLSHIVGNREISFHLALPISSEERMLKMESGLEALFDKFSDIERDTITFSKTYNAASQIRSTSYY